MIKNDSYVDDGASGSNSLQKLETLAADIKTILEGGGFCVKGMVKSGDSEAKIVDLWGSSELARVFGIKWDPTSDNFSFSVQINEPYKETQRSQNRRKSHT